MNEMVKHHFLEHIRSLSGWNLCDKMIRGQSSQTISVSLYLKRIQSILKNGFRFKMDRLAINIVNVKSK